MAGPTMISNNHSNEQKKRVLRNRSFKMFARSQILRTIPRTVVTPATKLQPNVAMEMDRASNHTATSCPEMDRSNSTHYSDFFDDDEISLRGCSSHSTSSNSRRCSFLPMDSSYSFDPEDDELAHFMELSIRSTRGKTKRWGKKKYEEEDAPEDRKPQQQNEALHHAVEFLQCRINTFSNNMNFIARKVMLQ
jgi:hypothetical protein